MRVARCPRCHRYRVVVGVRRPRIRQHADTRASVKQRGHTPGILCPGSGTPVTSTDLQELPR